MGHFAIMVAHHEAKKTAVALRTTHRIMGKDI